jgi:hypothetical protein
MSTTTLRRSITELWTKKSSWRRRACNSPYADRRSVTALARAILAPDFRPGAEERDRRMAVENIDLLGEAAGRLTSSASCHAM